jgi:hypothetical protein
VAAALEAWKRLPRLIAQSTWKLKLSGGEKAFRPDLGDVGIERLLQPTEIAPFAERFGCQFVKPGRCTWKYASISL